MFNIPGLSLMSGFTKLHQSRQANWISLPGITHVPASAHMKEADFATYDQIST